MTRRRRPALAVEAARRNAEQLARIGGDLRSARRRRGRSQAQVGLSVGVGRMTVSRIERGLGSGVTLDALQRVAFGVGRPLRLDLERDPREEPADAGHLAVQELVLRLGRAAGYARSFELQTRPADPRRSTDCGLRDDRRARLVLVECWNTIGDVGAAARSSDRKLAEASAYAAAIWGERPGTIGACWVVRATRRNRELVARYPETFATRFPGSSVGWLRAIRDGGPLPGAPGLVWSDLAATRLFAWRRPDAVGTRARLAASRR